MPDRLRAFERGDVKAAACAAMSDAAATITGMSTPGLKPAQQAAR
jgi:hypothetical protein